MSQTAENSAAGEHWSYRADIDGIRAIAVLAVVAFHTAPGWFKGGFLGVDIFFVISGYLISGIIFTALREQKFSFKEFYSRRARRIFPALVLVLASSMVFGWLALLPGEFQSLGKHVFGGATFLSNFILLAEVGYFDASAALKPLLHLWSLAVEEQFYLVWPVTAFLLWKRPKVLLLVICIVLLMSFGTNSAYLERNPSAAFYLPVMRFWELMLGSALACAAVFKIVDLPRRRYGRTEEAGSWVGLALMILPLALLGDSKWAFLPTLGALAVIAAGPKTFVSRRLLGSRPMVFVGLISYPLYLWHWPMLSFALMVEVGVTGKGLRLVLVASSFVLAWATFKYFEKPLRQGGIRTLYPSALILATLMALTGLAGFATYLAGGVGSRLKNFDAQANATREIEEDLLRRGVNNDDLNRLSDNGARIVVFGDSHAAQLGTGLKFAGRDVAFFVQGTCLPFQDVHTYKKQLQPWGGEQVVETTCQPWVNRRIADIANSKQTSVVVLAAFYNVYIDGRIPITSPGLDVADRKKIIERRMRETIATLVNAGKKVVLAIDVPELTEPCLPPRPYFFSREGSCVVSLEIANRQVGEYLSMLKDLERSFPAVRIFDPRTMFCDDAGCHGIAGGAYLYVWDRNHLTSAGVRQIGQLLSKSVDF